MQNTALVIVLFTGLLCAVMVESQQTYDGRNGPHVFGPPGEQVYIRGQNEGAYNVPGVGGTFQNSPASGAHVYTDERGNTFVHQKATGGRPSTHSVNGPDLTAVRGQYPGGAGRTVNLGPVQATRLR